MENLLIVSKTPKSIEQLSAIVSKCNLGHIDGACSAHEAKEKMAQPHAFDMVMVNTPLEDDSGLHLAQFAKSHGIGIILLVNNDAVEKVQEIAEELGAFLVEKPLNPPLLLQGVRFVAAAQKRFENLLHENEKLAQEVADIKIINRAKCCLMQYLKLSESAAHRYIEKKAMDTRKAKLHVAERILKTYEY